MTTAHEGMLVVGGCEEVPPLLGLPEALSHGTIVERQGTDDQGGAIQILGIPDCQREQNSLVFSLACTTD